MINSRYGGSPVKVYACQKKGTRIPCINVPKYRAKYYRWGRRRAKLFRAPDLQIRT